LGRYNTGEGISSFLGNKMIIADNKAYVIYKHTSKNPNKKCKHYIHDGFMEYCEYEGRIEDYENSIKYLWSCLKDCPFKEKK
jgi:hypothetical protein